MRRGAWAAIGWAAALAAAGPGAGAAETPRNPELMARDYFGPEADAEAHRALKISRLTVEVAVLGGMAETTVTAQIDNPGREQLEGDFVLDLPAGSVVTGYALNVGDTMVDGVLQSPRKARVTYEATVRRGVDPGLAEVTREGAFRTRVSPVLPGTGRTVRLKFVTPFDAARPYRLPINAPEAPKAVVVVRAPQKGRSVEVAGDLPFAFTTDAAGLETRGELSGRPVSGTLELRSRTVTSDLTLSRHADGEVFYDLSGEAPARAAAGIGRLRIYWDASRSRADDDHAAEIALIRRYVGQARPSAVELVQVSDTLTPGEAAPVGPEALAARLQKIAYRGATSYRALAAPAAAADVCLLVSDGRPSLDAWRPRNLGCRLYTISSTKDANGPLLAAFARASGGTRLDLAARDGRELLAQAIQGGPAVTSVTDAAGRAVGFTMLPAPRGRFRLVGPAPKGGALQVRLSDGSVRSYRLDGPISRHDGAGALWGASRVADLAATDRPDGDAVLALSRRYRVASEQASFLVLESAWDYARAGVEPPASLGKDALEQYAEARRDADREAEDARKDRLEAVIASWREQKAWWARSFDPRARSVRRKAPERRMAEPVAAPPPLPAPAPAPSPSVAPAAAAGVASSNEVQEVVTTASRIEGPADITLEVKPWDPQRPYLTALKAAPPAQFWAVYEAQAKDYGDLPAYYLDVAEMLFRAGRTADARRVALEAAEVPASDASTLMTLAERLTRYGDPERAMWVYEQVVYLQPDRPQPMRSLALALVARAERPGASAEARRADYQRALALLSKVILTPWNGDYDGIELVALMEANRIVPKLQALGVAKPALDPRLVARLDVDVRVVLEWNTDATDMDLWVDEPTHERAIYSNPLTAVGGHLSNDMTGGYGPEEYLLRRAPNGAYEVRINVFATDRLNPNGATTVRATLFRNYGRPNEAHEVIDLDLKGGDEAESQALVGKLQVRGGR